MFRKYERKEDYPELLSRLKELSTHADSSNGLLSSLGSFWTDYYGGLQTLQRASTGAIVPLSTTYKQLLDLVLESSILTIPSVHTKQVDLLLFDSKQAIIDEPNGTITFTDIGISRIPFLVSSLFDTGIVLQEGYHYTIKKDTNTDKYNLIFFINIFNDDTIVNTVYGFNDANNRFILFWAVDIVVDTTKMYDRYGRFIYQKTIDSTKYKWTLKALEYFYTNTKSIDAVRGVIDMMFGIPLTELPNEVVVKVGKIPVWINNSSYYEITTSNKTYYVFSYAKIKDEVVVGAVLPQYFLLATVNEINDYITDPSWIRNAPIPDELLGSGSEKLSEQEKRDIVDTVLKYNMVYVHLKLSYSTLEIYKEIEQQVKKLLKTGMPIYIYPSLNASFNPGFEEDIEHEFMNDIIDYSTGKVLYPADVKEEANYQLTTNFESKYSYYLAQFNGGHTYSCEPDIDCGSKCSKSVVYRFNGDASYGDKIECDWTYNCVPVFDGTYSYGVTYGLLANADRDELAVLRNSKIDYKDNFPYSQRSKTYSSYITYRDIYACDGTYKFGVSALSPKDKYGKTNIELYDFVVDLQNSGTEFSETVNAISDSFYFQQRTRQSLGN